LSATLRRCQSARRQDAGQARCGLKPRNRRHAARRWCTGADTHDEQDRATGRCGGRQAARSYEERAPFARCGCAAAPSCLRGPGIRCKRTVTPSPYETRGRCMRRCVRIHKLYSGSARAARAIGPAPGSFAGPRCAVAREIQSPCLLSSQQVVVACVGSPLRGRCLRAGSVHPNFDRSTAVAR